jgi:hypothetical protein
VQAADRQRVQLECDRSGGQGPHPGAFETYERGSEDGYWARHHFCGTCGVGVHYEIERRPNMVSIPAGAFADHFPPPGVEAYEERRCPWLPPLAPGEA